MAGLRMRLRAARECLRGRPVVFNVTGSMEFSQDETDALVRDGGLLNVASALEIRAPAGSVCVSADGQLWVVPRGGRIVFETDGKTVTVEEADDD